MSISNIVGATRVAELVVRKILNIKGKDRVLLVADHLSMSENVAVIYSIMGVCQSSGAETTLAVVPDREPGIERVTDSVEKSFEGADVMIGITKSTGAPLRNLTFVRLTKEKRIRGIWMVKRGWKEFTSPAVLEVDHDELLRSFNKVREAATGERIHIESKLGTDFQCSIKGRKWGIDGGYAHNPGEVSNIIWGEIDIGPIEGSADGRLVVEGPITHLGLPKKPVEIVVKNGRVVAVDGDEKKGPELRNIMNTVKNADNIAEIGLGLNPKAERHIGENLGPQQQQEDKKAVGTAHVAIGDGTIYGQLTYAEVHMDLTMYHPSVKVDDRQIFKDGILVL